MLSKWRALPSRVRLTWHPVLSVSIITTAQHRFGTLAVAVWIRERVRMYIDGDDDADADDDDETDMLVLQKEETLLTHHTRTN